MLKRIITAIVALIVFIPVLVFSDTVVFPIAMSFCAAVGCFEMLSCIGQKKNIALSLPIYAAAVFFPLFMRYMSERNDLFGFLKLSLAVVGVIIVYVMGVAVFDHKRLKVTDAGLAFTSCFYIVTAFTSIVYIRDFAEHGQYLYLLVFLCAWMTDSFAYFTGRLLGKHKLIPEISPKKTVEGAIGGVVFSVITAVVFGFVIQLLFTCDCADSVRANYLVLAISGVFLSVVSQVGDLIMSAIKRHYGIKDYGKLFPGHGGILDRFDSVLAVSITLALICTYFNLL